MAELCPICKGTKLVTPVFNNRKLNCYNCLSEPDATGRRVPTGYININLVRCPVCEGGKTITSMGGMSSIPCSYCFGAGNVSESKIRADVEAINELDSKRADMDKGAKEKEEIDKGKSESSKGK